MSARTEPCMGGCDHTEDEHRAFDDGLAAGKRGGERTIPKRYRGAMAREGWLAGYSVGESTRRSTRDVVESAIDDSKTDGAWVSLRGEP